MDTQRVANMKTASLYQAIAREKLLWDNGDNDRWCNWNVYVAL